MLQFIYESLSLVLAIIAGVYAFANLNKFYRLLLLQVIVWFLFYLYSYVLTMVQRHDGAQLNNHWLFNTHVFIEAFILLLAAFYYNISKTIKSIMFMFLIFFVCLYGIRIGLNGIMKFDHYLLIAQSITLFIPYSILLYMYLHDDSFSFRSPEVWIFSGLLIYLACNVPYFSLFNYLNNNHPDLSSTLFHFIVDVLANIRYLFLAVGFWIIGRNNNLKQVYIHE